MSQPLFFALYEQASVGCGGAPGLWTHPLDDRLGVNGLERWRHTALTAEEAGLDALFFADVLGLYDVYCHSSDAAVRWAVEAPANDPFIYVPALAEVARSLSFVITASTTYEHPFSLARRFGTLDHITDGRIGWNIVTSYLDSAARNFGFDQQHRHGDRYARADEFLDVTYKLWEASWDDDAVVANKSSGVYARPGSVRPINHQGEHFSVAGPGLTSPSRQRTPTLFQAGWSPRGRQFAAEHAEVVLLPKSDPEEIRTGVRDIRERAVRAGRRAEDIKALALAKVVVAGTTGEALSKFDDLQSSYHLEAQLVSYAGDTGIDLSGYRDDEPLTTESNGLTSYVHSAGPGSPPLTAGDVKRRFSNLVRGKDLLFIGDAATVADSIVAHATASELDGYLINPLISPGTLDDFATLVVPELKQRGAMADRQSKGTLRSRVRDDHSDRLPSEHRARVISTYIVDSAAPIRDGLT
ncbi:NtaA/DmoA family FMN-dependent monooxygenase [Mycolicibacterium sp. Y3]